ncbi:G-type lectin S-receptor-like serine/threonine-protein kinase SD1-1 [Alnus glutinosa]|uniref:G-type lectin S-receptor-like serine/threonine-protein kinase SD1-1 n=1 Tax=Alnus glutinosa TaxID=3517 RepID=UPI002D773B79|nr:G-type lectin S-receptor-like serine/threonine-protein kinase SD1-1 [Alnus glutinosa]
MKDCDNESVKEDMELPVFDLAAITNATDNFSNSNKLGEGGFGPVYKGTLSEGRDIAVKMLSNNSTQGLNELKNEVILIAKLQHRNLVKILGCCIQENENMLIYEYMPNKSLDCFIFDQANSKLLDWHKRINIINGVAKGLLYLHEDSRLRIIHRDLKANNILLDNNMNPKISDFSLVRSFWGDQIDSETNRIIGTYGYMSPEYAMHGQYSVKSDVFSFGVLVLEQRPEDRPNMSSVIQMFSSESLLPKPKQPGFFTDSPKADSSSSKHGTCSGNEMTTTIIEAR